MDYRNRNLASFGEYYHYIIRIWNPNNGSLLNTLNGHTSLIRSLKTLPNGNLASVSTDSTIKIWNLDKGLLLYTINNTGLANVNYWIYQPFLPIFSMLTDGNLAYFSCEHSIKIWN